MLPIPLASSRPKFCHLCGTALIFDFTLFSNGMVVCPQCSQTLPRCTRCNVPARALTPVDDHRLCSNCLKSLPQCSVCQKPLAGQYFVFGDTTKPLCANCRPRCSACQETITGQYFFFGDPPRIYCAACQNRPRCQLCGAPLGPDAKQLSGGQTRCGECAQTMVLDDQEVRALYEMVTKQARAIFEQDVRHIPTLHVVEPAELVSVRSQLVANPAAGDSQTHLVGTFVQRGEDRAIYIERGLPRVVLIGTLAHEYGHAWQSDHAPHGQDLFRREGFAEWVAWSLLIALGHTREAAQSTRREDLYGRGLRHFIELEQQAGSPAVFREAASS